MKQPKFSISDEEIYELREQGMTYDAIASYFEEKGKKISLEAIRKRCKRIYMEKGKEEPKVKVKRMKDITDEEIYELREQGMSYREIERYFKYRGKEISFETIRERCKRIYEQKGEEEPKVKRMKDITDKEIYELREQGMSYMTISSHFDKKGIKIAWYTIRERCKRIYMEKGKEEPKVKVKRMKDIIDEDIYELREQGMTYEAIASYFDKKCIKISWATIRERCKRIYMEKGKEEPKVKVKTMKDITDEEIYELREQGMTYEAIASYFNKKCIKISWATIRERCKRIYKEKGKEEPKAKRKETKRRKDITDEEIYELREQGITYDAIARYFEEKGIKISNVAIRERCKRIYKEKGKEEPKAKRKKQDKTDSESLETLNKELNEKIKKKLEMEKLLKTLKGYVEVHTEGVEK